MTVGAVVGVGDVTPRLDYAALLALLHANAGRWAKIASFHHVTNTPLTLRSHGCEVVTRDDTKTGGTFDVWARWNSGAVPQIRTRQGGPKPKVVWEEPPPRRKVGRKGVLDYDAVVRTAWLRPQHWLRLPDVPTSQRVPVTVALKKRGCEAVTRKSGDGTVALWVRWPKKKTPTDKGKTLSSLRWEPPPSAQVGLPGVLQYDAILTVLQGSPGRWARVGVLAEGRVEGPQTTLRRKGCDVAVRSRDDTIEIWAVWPIGPTPPPTTKAKAGDIEGFQWGTPPKSRTGRTAKHDYEALTEKIRAGRGKWVVLGEFPRNEAVAAYHALRRRGCAIRTKKLADGNTELSGRAQGT